MISNILKPQILFWLIPILLIFLTLLFKKFVDMDFEDREEKKKFRLIILLTRTLIFILLVLALAKPYGEVSITTPGNPKLLILVDNSTSMQVMDLEFINQLKTELEKDMPVSIKTLSSGMRSDIADNTLSYLEKDTNLLLITDGNVNSGTELGDVALLAANLNSTISALELEEKEQEAGVYITGPAITVAGVNNTFTVHITNLGNQQANLKVSIDNEIVFEQATRDLAYTFTKEFGDGEHKIIAEVSAEKDYFTQNNVFYKVVSVVKKPKVLLVMDGSAAGEEKIFNELYDVTKLNYIPDNINDYSTAIIYDMPASISGVDKLADYLIDQQGSYYGNGLFVIGGFDSFDKGNYQNSVLESFLPVYVGKASRKRGSSNIAIAIDFSGSSGDRYEVIRDPLSGKILELKKVDSNIQDIEKAFAVSVINGLGVDNSVGVSVFSSQSAMVQELQPLFLIKKDLIDKISKIQQPPGQSFFHVGLSGAYALLKDHVGTNNVIMITDGNTGSDSIRQETLNVAKTINSRGVKVYVVGTGRNVDEEFLKSVAYNGGGIYFSADQKNNLKILFGDPEDTKFGELFDLFIINPYHFITQGLSLDASLYGYNQVIPKSSAQLLITTQHGEPALTVWNYGLGRVASLNVFSGNNNLGELLNQKNSILLTRITNWCIGDPQRKEPYYVTIEDSRLDEPIEVIVKSDKYPSAEGLTFTRRGENQYQTELLASQNGFGQVLGKNYAVNYETEYQTLGMNPRLEEVVSMSGGKIFKPSQSKEIASFVKSVSKKTKVERTTIIWPFILAAVIIFLIEIWIRKSRDMKRNR